MRLLFLFLLLGLLGIGKWERIEAVSPSLEERLKSAIPIKEEGENLVGYLQIERERPIDQSTYLYVKSALEYYKKLGVCFILLDLNTPGGEVFAAMKIADLLHQIDVQDKIPVVAFIDNWAISAGAMLAYASRFIGIVNTASMGAAEPITVGAEGKMETASEKVNSALRSEFINLAHYYHRNPLIAEAMVDKDLILVRRNGQIIRLEKEEEIRTDGKDPDQIISRKGKLLTLNAQELIDEGVADFMVVPERIPPVTSTELSVGRWPASKNLLFHSPFFARIPNAQIVSFSDWKIGFFSFLSHPLISSLLMMGLILGIYMEMSHPGFGFPAILALICLGLILLSSFAVETASWLEVIFLATGLLLIGVEVLFLPGFGVAGVMGGILTLVSLFALMVPLSGPIQWEGDWSQLNDATVAFLERLGYFASALVASILVILFFARYLTPTLLKNSRIVLEGDQEGSTAGMDLYLLPSAGAEGTVHSTLRPGGKIMIGKQIFDAFSEGMTLEKGKAIVVKKIEGSRIIVALRE
jgi:membrane-bound ClpP family serine protease